MDHETFHFDLCVSCGGMRPVCGPDPPPPPPQVICGAKADKYNPP